MGIPCDQLYCVGVEGSSAAEPVAHNLTQLVMRVRLEGQACQTHTTCDTPLQCALWQIHRVGDSEDH